MRIISSLCALAAAALLGAAAPAAAQLTDQSGPITFTVDVARYVEVVSDAPSTHNMTEWIDWRGGSAPGLVVSTSSTLQGNPPMREIRANTPYRISIVGLRADGKLVFANQHGDEMALTTLCDHLTTPDPASRTTATIFDCMGSPVFSAVGSRWVLFHAYTPRRTDTDGARAGVYTATVYIQIDAA